MLLASLYYKVTIKVYLSHIDTSAYIKRPKVSFNSMF
jgi:hypothetical protein